MPDGRDEPGVDRRPQVAAGNGREPSNNVVRNQRRSRRRHRNALDRLPSQTAEPGHTDDVAGRLDDERAMRP
ncbi:hypothetical protein [Sinosporangium siamense]|uniref:Uncharacterized protein n=1 Tax=Sinosporangium siamense TaxID=1367973 RepID=A0A919V2H4_9ACTN|nr:hypothetical protein [Sinosporangium siamense]GII89925.1 hypothetical protein Ssi02_01560 [Sinosporangium siamense]